VNPETKADLGYVQQFVVTSGGTGAGGTGSVTIGVYPHIIGVTSPLNPLQTVVAAPAGGEAVAFMGAAGIAYPQNIAFHQDAFTLVTADLFKPNGVHFCSAANYDGVAMRIVQQYNISDDTMPCRIDVLYGWTTLIPEFATRVWG